MGANKHRPQLSAPIVDGLIDLHNFALRKIPLESREWRSGEEIRAIFLALDHIRDLVKWYRWKALEADELDMGEGE